MQRSAYLPFTNASGPATPPPPRLQWGWVLLLSGLTRSLFADIWLLVQANWACNVTGRTDLRLWAIANVCKVPAGLLLGVVAGAGLADGTQTPEQTRLALRLVTVCFGLAAGLVYLVTVYKMRAALEGRPIDVPLGGVMTFFFGTVYFQYFLRDWQPDRYGTGMFYPQYTYPNVPPQA